MDRKDNLSLSLTWLPLTSQGSPRVFPQDPGPQGTQFANHFSSGAHKRKYLALGCAGRQCKGETLFQEGCRKPRQRQTAPPLGQVRIWLCRYAHK